ncbi:GNAT family N-acetyltransferase [Aeromonas simiae]|uniref:GNAT family N-acetyltransferase n=1 Tax=Aeromonas simiae TaxID=218936 RepID=UPI0005A9DC05|nr:GNAT family N-acetyltransferase [Aeromonas simiae]MDO2949448.1 GNAT family N-acetyltransferase [Aeromonas simiae]MDO2953070.1 GNAT family N-acetyltransferase [Aeromonas simiae]MDO2956720.1 GNAT family N-acetyltransferase [Aeromonas simiae]
MNQIPHLVTARTRLTVLTPDHADLILDYYQRNRSHLEPWEPLRPANFYTLPFWHQRLRDSYQQCFAGTALNLAALDESGRMIASCNFTNIILGVFQACHLGYSIDATRQGEGLMQEILTCAIDHLFQERGLHRIMACYMPRNERSGRLLTRLGFEQEGRARDYLMINGRWEDHILTSKLCTTP